jgi:hypothetical protein
MGPATGPELPLVHPLDNKPTLDRIRRAFASTLSVSVPPVDLDQILSRPHALLAQRLAAADPPGHSVRRRPADRDEPPRGRDRLYVDPVET